ncbi:hypothetical protein CHCC14809_2267 [Bacillus licheniformis]|nr:hypothetical protein BaDB11_00118 [Bacillus licheniformis]PZW85781.1 hypothetical protein DEU48_102373 [Bacillus sp. AG442]AVI45406.1 hypothetical protein BL14DL4_00138 [Bacillus licheniformis]MCU9959256.1 hypothetical protein [Bacillus licheniformis]TWK64310.1 hypothetical protein CHCC20343_2965 [Bacillus licheniformis]
MKESFKKEIQDFWFITKNFLVVSGALFWLFIIFLCVWRGKSH